MGIKRSLFVEIALLLLLSTGCHNREHRVDNATTPIDSKHPREDRLGGANEPGESAEGTARDSTILATYEDAVQAYLDEDWDACIQGFRDVVHKYKKYKSAVIKCRRKCRAEAQETIPIFREDIEDLHFYEKKVKETLCILKCNQDYRETAGKKSLKRMQMKDEFKLIKAEHYGYLHNCYFQKNYFQDAANAVFTYLIYNSDHKQSKLSLAYYMSLSEVNNASIRNLENEPFVNYYIKGVKAYEEAYFEEAALRLENSLRLFLESEEQCRFYCEGPFDQGWNPEFTTAVSNHFVFNLHCKRRCSRILSTLNGEYRSGFLANHFNYLQFAYYKLGNLRTACEAVQSYLIFYPADETMLSNKKYYLSLPIVDEDYFKPREEIMAYVKRQEYEMHLLLYIKEEFNAFEDKVAATDLSNRDKSIEVDDPQDTVSSNRPYLIFNNWAKSLTKNHHIHVIADKEKLGGEYRYLLEGLLDPFECEAVIRLAEMTTWEGDGYEDNISPHSEFERFEGVTIGRLAVLTYFGLLELKALKLLIKITEIARNVTEQIMNINQRLYITYTHLVCRTALPGSPKNRTDYSHDIHADNCLVESGGACRSESPAYVWRDYSSILYLNEDFSGGDFVFAGRAGPPGSDYVESTVRPRCGRMLSFSSGPSNLHGVTAVTEGRRCALGLWFTLQPGHEDVESRLAEVVAERVEAEGPRAELAAGLMGDAGVYEAYRSSLIEELVNGGMGLT